MARSHCGTMIVCRSDKGRSSTCEQDLVRTELDLVLSTVFFLRGGRGSLQSCSRGDRFDRRVPGSPSARQEIHQRGRRPAPCTCRRRRPSSPPQPWPSSSGDRHNDLDEFLCWNGGSVGLPSIVKLSDRLLRDVNGIKRIRAIRFRGTYRSMLNTLGSSTLCSELALGIAGVIRVQFSSLNNFTILVLFSSTRDSIPSPRDPSSRPSQRDP